MMYYPQWCEFLSERLFRASCCFLLQAVRLLFLCLMDSLPLRVDLDFSVQCLTDRLHLTLTLVPSEEKLPSVCRFSVSITFGFIDFAILSSSSFVFTL